MPSVSSPRTMQKDMNDIYRILGLEDETLGLYPQEPYAFGPPTGSAVPLNTPATTCLPFLEKSFEPDFGSRSNAWRDTIRGEPYQLPVSPIKLLENRCQSHAKSVETISKCCNAGCSSSACSKPLRRFSQGRIGKSRGELLARQSNSQEQNNMEVEINPGAQTTSQGGPGGTSRKTENSPVHNHGETSLNRNPMKRNSSLQFEEPASKKSSAETPQTSSGNISISPHYIPSAPKPSSSQALEETNTPPLRQAKASHCLVERKYRENLNTKFDILRRAIPSMHSPTDDPSHQALDFDDAGNSAKHRKADVLSNATDYVRQMEEKNRMMGDEIEFLRSRMTAIEKLIKCENCWLLREGQRMRFDPNICDHQVEWMGQHPN
ncbi:hypothetical protein MMC13_006111 [Lambiella insularis]|nr:hypothetical protein [Lambiella insularis]